MTKKQCRSRGTACPSPADGAVNAVHLETMLDSSILPVVGRNLPWLQLQVAASACEVTWLCYIFVGSFSPNHCDWVEAVSTSFVHILGRKEEQRLWHPWLFLLRRLPSVAVLLIWAHTACVSPAPAFLAARVGPSVPRQDRPVREGTRVASIETGLAAAAAKLSQQVRLLGK